MLLRRAGLAAGCAVVVIACATPVPPRSPQQEATWGVMQVSRGRQLKKRCADKDMLACEEFGDRAVFSDNESHVNDKAARRALEEACAAEEILACSELGELLKATGVTEDYARGEKLRRHACAKGLDICDHRGWSRGQFQDQYINYMARACDGGSAVGCFGGAALIIAYEDNKRRSESDDFSRSRLLLDRGCKLGFSTACLYRADLEERALGGDATPGYAVKMMLEACRLGDSIGCDLAKDRGGAVPADQAAAANSAAAAASAAPASSAMPSPATSAAPASSAPAPATSAH